jgi:hypothetical protein
MPRPALLFFLSLAAAVAGGVALETASRGQAQSRVPLLNAVERALRKYGIEYRTGRTTTRRRGICTGSGTGRASC